MEKCTMCVQRIRRETRSRTPSEVADGMFSTACAQACPTSAIVFGNLNDPNSRVAQLQDDPRRYKVFEHLGTHPSVTYLRKVEITAVES
jgi:molybdopterin-containing oxidoreductase family iron-sulfur binding subunit